MYSARFRRITVNLYSTNCHDVPGVRLVASGAKLARKWPYFLASPQLTERLEQPRDVVRKKQVSCDIRSLPSFVLSLAKYCITTVYLLIRINQVCLLFNKFSTNTILSLKFPRFARFRTNLSWQPTYIAG